MNSIDAKCPASVRAFLICLAIFLLSTPVFCKPVVVQHPPFTIVDYAKNPATVQLVTRILDQQQPLLESYFDYQLPDSNRIVIAANAGQFYQHQNLTIPEWAAAAYLTGRRIILVKSPGWKGSIRSLQEDLRHELVHLFVDRLFGSAKIPLWYNEGLSEILSGESIDLVEAGKISADLQSKDVMFLSDIDSLRNFQVQQIQMAYIYSFSAASFLIECMGGITQLPVFHNNVKVHGWPAALRLASGYSEREFEIYWFRDLREKYRWYLLLNFDSLLWIAIIGIFFLVFWLKRARMRQIFRRWNDEEINNYLQ
ncbi:MAG: hypothetical protein ACRBF0_05690 [Calditrichia bacterium]